ncbi:MAG TPA: zinc ribbon domain-containing protein [Acidilobales archaeon]|nr:zinc ribbon domain-containing protein [Acidilobales archaeon]
MMEAVKCPKCGKEVPPDAQFCPYCGTKISTSSTSSLSIDVKYLRRVYISLSTAFINQFMLTASLALLTLIVIILRNYVAILMNYTYFILTISVIVIAHIALSFINMTKFNKTRRKFRRLLTKVVKK